MKILIDDPEHVRNKEPVSRYYISVKAAAYRYRISESVVREHIHKPGFPDRIMKVYSKIGIPYEAFDNYMLSNFLYTPNGMQPIFEMPEDIIQLAAKSRRKGTIDRLYITVQDAEERYGISDSKVRELFYKKDFPAGMLQIGRRILIPLQPFDEFMLKKFECKPVVYKLETGKGKKRTRKTQTKVG